MKLSRCLARVVETHGREMIRLLAQRRCPPMSVVVAHVQVKFPTAPARPPGSCRGHGWRLRIPKLRRSSNISNAPIYHLHLPLSRATIEHDELDFEPRCACFCGSCFGGQHNWR